MKTSLPVPKRIELVFDSVYLISAMALGIWLLAISGESTKQLWGIMAITLAAGDSFHLLPRMAAAYTGDTPRFAAAMGVGKGITSVTMTVFYLLLWHSGLMLFSLKLPAQTTILYLLAGVRIILCLLPQNEWKSGGEGAIAIYRNIPFTLEGLLVLWLFARYAGGTPALQLMWLAITISFACYLPVVLWAGKYPKLGMLMLPKTCAYLWIICMGFWI